MKKLFLGLILFGFVFAGIALACVCYINPDDTVSWCEPADCNLKQSYCVGEGSTCGDVNGVTITCCPGLNLNCQRLVHGETKVCVKSCVAEKGSCTVSTDCCAGGCSNKHCCPTDYYWREDDPKTSINEAGCAKPDYCGTVCSGTAIFHIPFCNFVASVKACCSIEVVGGTSPGWMPMTVYIY